MGKVISHIAYFLFFSLNILYLEITKDFHFITYFEHEDPNSPKKPYTVEIKKISPHNNTITFNVNGNKLEIEGELKFSSVLHLIVNNKPMSIQPISKSVDEISISYKGSWFKLKVLPDACHDLLKYMKERPKIDTSKVVLAPMPGAIKNVSVKVGDTVSWGRNEDRQKNFRWVKDKKLLSLKP